MPIKTSRYKQSKTSFEYLMQRVSTDIEQEDPCWIFTGGKDKDGYGQCHKAKTARQLGVTRAHQMSYKTFNGDIPDGMWVLHKCDNPSCCNPNHLFLGTAKENNEDMWRKGRWRSGMKPKYDHDYILSQRGIKTCEQVADELGCSYSLVCQVWRARGFFGRSLSSGD